MQIKGGGAVLHFHINPKLNPGLNRNLTPGLNAALRTATTYPMLHYELWLVAHQVFCFLFFVFCLQSVCLFLIFHLVA